MTSESPNSLASAMREPKFFMRYMGMSLALATPAIIIIILVFPPDGPRDVGSLLWKIIAATVVSAFIGMAFAFAKRAGAEVDLEADKIREAVAAESGDLRALDWRVLHGRLDAIADAADGRMGPTVLDYQGLADEVQEAARSSALDKQEAILREIYTQGLAQAKLSFRVSLFFASLGAVLLFSGVGLAIFRAPADGQDYASVVSLVAGVVINVVSSLFFVQSNHTRRDMAKQGALLREESQEDRRFSGARELVGAIDDDDLRDRTTADIALRLMSAVGSPAGPAKENAPGDAKPDDATKA